MVAALAALLGCATEETTNFGEPSRVTTVGGDEGPVPAPVASSGGGCVVDFACGGLSFAQDVFEGIFDSLGGAQPGGGCTDAQCHQIKTGNLQLTADDAVAARIALLTFVPAKISSLDKSIPYVSPCVPEQSQIMCNLNFGSGVTNEFFGEAGGKCGSLMPKIKNPSPVHSALNQSQYDTIVKWIQCGAPGN
jgi:hypothetical protein